jgi:glycosyltransferase involved in cell wall biosynthesis
MKSICVHTLVKNEEKYLWFSVMSVINYVDKILIWDTGSTDKTVNIISEIIKRYPGKVGFRNVGEINADDFTKVRQQMLNETKADWFIVVDGDEIWWDESIRKVVKVVKSSKGRKVESIVVPNIILIGDIYHHQEEAAGRYKLAGKFGHYNLRAINRNIPGLKSDKPHGTWGWVDGESRMIQDRPASKMAFIDAPYLHATFLPRSSTHERDLEVPKRKHKLKYELGIPFRRDFYYPEVFFRYKPAIVPSLWAKMDNAYMACALIQTPIKKLKRRLIHGKIGY